MKRLTMIGMAALLLMAASCKKDKEQDIENAGSGFRATLESPTSGNKTHLVNGTAVHWNSGDQILIANSSSNPVTMTFATTSNDATATFTATDDLPADFYTAPYTAYYPAGAFSGSTLTLGGTQTATIVADAKGHYEPTFGIGANPMISNSTTTELAFKNICGLLQLQLYSQSSCTVSSITITSADNLCGTGTVAWNDGEPTFEITSNGSSSVTLNCGTGVALSPAPTSFYIALPAGTLASGFSVTVTASNGDTWEASTTKNNHIERSKITPMPAKEVICTPTVSVESVTLNTASLSLNVSATEQLTATVLPEGANQNVTWTSSNTDFATVDETGLVTAIAAGTTTITATSVADNTKSASCIVTVTVPVPEGALSGVFTIDAEGRQVRFSKGNLQYLAVGGDAGDAASSAGYKESVGGTWRFAVNQYDIIGENNTNLSATYTGWIDLFAWGTSGWNHNNTQYFPWSKLGSAGSNFYAYGDKTNSLDDGVNIPDFGCNMADWGYNTIYSDVTPTTGWRTLSSNEWLTLTGRTKGGDKLYGLATVNGQEGLIILPDDWNCPDGLSFTYGAYVYATNSYSVSDWTKMQNAGAVFLPKAGVRKQTTYPHTDGSIFNYAGYYWTTTYDKNYFYFQSKPTNTVSVNDMLDYYGLPVRLVKDVLNGFNGGNANNFEPDTW